MTAFWPLSGFKVLLVHPIMGLMPLKFDWKFSGSFYLIFSKAWDWNWLIMILLLFWGLSYGCLTFQESKDGWIYPINTWKSVENLFLHTLGIFWVKIEIFRVSFVKYLRNSGLKWAKKGFCSCFEDYAIVFWPLNGLKTLLIHPTSPWFFFFKNLLKIFWKIILQHF